MEKNDAIVDTDVTRPDAKEAISAKIVTLIRTAPTIAEKVEYRKMLTIPVSNGCKFHTLFVPVSITDLTPVVDEYFTTTFDHLLTAMIKRPELFMTPADLVTYQQDVLTVVETKFSHLDYSQAPFAAIVREGKNIKLLVELLDATINDLQFTSCSREKIADLVRAVLTGDTAFQDIVLPPQDHLLMERIFIITDALTMFAEVFTHSKRRNPTTINIIRDLLIVSPLQDTPREIITYLRHYLSPKLHPYQSYDHSQPNILQRARKSYVRFRPIPLNERQDLAKFVAKMGLHSRDHIFHDDPARHIDFATWCENFCVVAMARGLDWYGLSDNKTVTLYNLIEEIVTTFADPLLNTPLISVKYWHKLYQLMVRWRFPVRLLADLDQYCIEYYRINRQRAPHLLKRDQFLPLFLASRQWLPVGSSPVHPALAIRGLDKAYRSEGAKTALARWVEPWRPHADALYRARRDPTVTTSTRILQKVSNNYSVLHRNYRETRANLTRLLVTDAITPLSIWNAITAITMRYFEGTHVAGSTAIVPAHAFSAPIFQMALSSFHQAGSAKSNSTIVRQIKELTSVTRTENMKNPSMTIVPIISDMSYHDAIDLRGYFITSTVKDYLVGHQTRVVAPATVIIRLLLDIRKMIVTKVTPDMIVNAISPRLPPGSIVHTGALHEGYIEIAMTDNGIQDGEYYKFVVITKILPSLENIVAKGIHIGTGIITGIFPIQVDVWSRSVITSIDVLYNVDGRPLPGTIVQLRYREMPRVGITVNRLKRLITSLTGLDENEVWMLPYHDETSIVTDGPPITDPLMPKNIQGLPYTGFEQYIFIPRTVNECLPKETCCPSPVTIIQGKKRQDALEENDYEKQRQRQRVDALIKLKDGPGFDIDGPVNGPAVLDVDYIRPESRVSRHTRRWLVETDGTNLASTMLHPLANPLFTISNSVTEIESTLGICAASKLQLFMYMKLIKDSDSQLDWSHLLLIQVYHCATGVLIPLNRTGLEKSGFDTATKISSSHANIITAESSAIGTIENINSYASELMTGTLVGMGTGSFDVIMSPEDQRNMRAFAICTAGIGMGSATLADETSAALVTEYIEDEDEKDEDQEEVEEGHDEEENDGDEGPANSGIQNASKIQNFKGEMFIGDMDEDEFAKLVPTDIYLRKLLANQSATAPRILFQMLDPPEQKIDKEQWVPDW